MGDGNYVNVQSFVEVPGDAIYCSAESTVAGSVSMQGNSLTQHMEDGNLSASAEFALAAAQYVYSRGRNAVMDADVEAVVNDNVITGDTMFNGISVITAAYASTSDLRADLPDQPVANLVASVEVQRNEITGAFGGISVEHYAYATNALSEVHDTYDAMIADNVVSASQWGIWAYVSESTYTESPAGSPTVDGSQTVAIADNVVSGYMEAFGIQVMLLTDYGYMGTLTASADFSVTGNTVSECEEGIYCEMYPAAAQDQSLLVQGNMVTDTVNNGIYINGGIVNVHANERDRW